MWKFLSVLSSLVGFCLDFAHALEVVEKHLDLARWVFAALVACTKLYSGEGHGGI